MTWLGTLSSWMLIACGIPLLYEAYTEGHAKSVPTMFLVLWWLGEILGTAYVIYNTDWPLLWNYGFNMFLTSELMRLKFWPRQTGGK